MIKPEYSVINNAFKLLAKSTELSLGEYTSVTQSEADIEHYLKLHVGTFSTVLYGAFSHKTITSPLPGNIIDMLVLFRADDIKHTYPSKIFTKLSRALIEKYQHASILEGRNILMLPVNDFYYKIRPAYPIATHTYMLPDEKFNEWVKYDIHSQNDILLKENVRHKGKLVEIIRIVKTWNRVSGNLFDAYYLELLVTEVLSGYEITSYAETLRYIFQAGVAKVVFQKYDPANIEFQVEGLNDISDLISAMKLIKKSFYLADEAVHLEQQGYTKKALLKWNKLFPQTFPTSIDIIVGQARNDKIKGVEALKMLVAKNTN